MGGGGGGGLKTQILLDSSFTICGENVGLRWVLKTETLFELMLQFFVW